MSIFAAICYGWAAIGIGSRIAMGIMGNRWKQWELTQAYSSKRPAWVVGLAIFGLLLIAFTWYRTIVGTTELGWIVATLVSLTAVKAGMFLFKYEQFREFVSRALSSRRTMTVLNIAVLLFSGGLVAMGLLLYS